jgi:hypothetical protein
MFKQANAAQLAGNWPEAERRYRALTRLKPLWAYHNLGVVYVATGRFVEAETAFRTALSVEPTAPAPRYGLGMLLLADGRYAEGWPLYEARREIPQLRTNRPKLAYPEWRGEDLRGKHLLVVTEQGLGDQIQFARFLPELAARGARVTFACAPSLTRLFGGLGVELLPVTPDCILPDADYWTLLMSLPLHMGLTLEGLSGRPYLSVEAKRPGGGVGVVARGGTSHANDRFRSLGPEAAEHLLTMGRNLAPEATGARDFQETAEIVAGLELVISVDTSVAHLAGALGKPVWILLPAVETDWRWLRKRADSPWYASARLYRQQAPGKWGAALGQVTTDLGVLGVASSA